MVIDAQTSMTYGLRNGKVIVFSLLHNLGSYENDLELYLGASRPLNQGRLGSGRALKRSASLLISVGSSILPGGRVSQVLVMTVSVDVLKITTLVPIAFVTDKRSDLATASKRSEENR